MRGIADEKDAAMAELLHAAALEGIDADPLELEFAVGAEHGLDPGNDLLRLLLFLRVGLPAELEVDAPHVVGLLVQQHRLVRMERRVDRPTRSERAARRAFSRRRSGTGPEHGPRTASQHLRTGLPAPSGDRQCRTAHSPSGALD
jgi:hypothetical protein